MKRARLPLLAALVGFALATPPAAAQPQPAKPKPANAAAPAAKPVVGIKETAGPALVYAGATVFTGAGAPLTDATVVIVGGKIQQIGKGLAAPVGAQVLAAQGMVVTPGLVDALTSVGLIEVALEQSTRDDSQRGDSDLIRAGFRAADGYNPASPVIGVTRAEGITSVGVVPNGGLISGQSLWADLDGQTAADAIVAAPLALHIHLDADGSGADIGHASAFLRVREAFDDARTFAKTRAAWERNQSRRLAPSRLDLEALASALDGKIPVVFHVDRAAEIMAALNVAKEFKLRPVIAGGAEAWKVAAALAAAKVPVFVDPLLQEPRSFDTLGARADNAALLNAAGVAVGITTGDTHNARKLRQLAGNAVRAGLPREAAIAAITRVPAEAFGMGTRYGTLAAGKVANLVVWSGDPLEISTQVVEVVIRGQKVSLKNRQSALLEKYRRLPR